MRKLNGIRNLRASRLAAGVVVALATLLMAGGAQAQEEHFDVLLFDDGSGNLGAAGVDVDTSLPDFGVFAIEGELFGDSTGPSTYSGDEPGFFGFGDVDAGLLAPGDNLPGGAAVSADFLVEPTLGLSLSYWDDVSGTFGATPNNERLTLSDGVATVFGSAFDTTEVTGVAIGTTGADGFIDDHPVYTIEGSTSGSAATTGVYLAYGVANVAGLSGPSNPFWFILGTLDGCEETLSCTPGQEAFNEGIELQIESAIDYVNANLVPEPSTAWLLAGGLLLAASRSQRRERAVA